MSAELSPNQLSLAPLGAGDLIDRAVRLYRRHLFVLIRTAAPPVIIAAAGWILFSIFFKRIFSTPDTSDLLLYILISIASFGLMLVGYLFTLVVMGGATRTLVAHLLNNEPVTARATYAAVRARFWGLLGAVGRRDRHVVVLFHRGPGGVCSAGDAGRGQGRVRVVQPQLFAGPRQRAPLDGNDVVHHLRYLLGADDSVAAARLVRLSQRIQSDELGGMAGLVFDCL